MSLEPDDGHEKTLRTQCALKSRVSALSQKCGSQLNRIDQQEIGLASQFPAVRAQRRTDVTISWNEHCAALAPEFIALARPP
jgi:hypothetical protein